MHVCLGKGMMEHTARILSPTFPPELRYVTESMSMLAGTRAIEKLIYSGFTIEISRDTRCKKAPRGYSQGATEVNWESNFSILCHPVYGFFFLLEIAYPCWQLCLHGGYSDDSVGLSAGHSSGVVDTLAGSRTPLPCVPFEWPIQS